MLTTEQKEDLRHETLKALAIRAPAALAVRQIGKPLARELPFTVEPADVEAALDYMRGVGLVEFTVDDLGVTKYWKATTAGIQKFERS